jgi:putative acetyltransferase
VSPEIVIRPERIADVDAAHAVVAAAFEREGEADLVDALRRGARPFISLVATREEIVVGHIAFSPLRLDGEGPLAMGLAPLSVLPAMQSCGIGSRLTRAGLQACRAIETGPVFVLGHAEYYPRFGFRPAAELGFYFMTPGGEPSFFVLELSTGAAAGRSGRVRYHSAFDAV